MSEDKKGAVSLTAKLKLDSYGVDSVELTDEATGRSDCYFLRDERVGNEKPGSESVVNFLRLVAWLCGASEIKTVFGEARGRIKVGAGLWPVGLRPRDFLFASMYEYGWCFVWLDPTPNVVAGHRNVTLSDAAANTLCEIAEDGFFRKRVRFYSTELGTWDFNPDKEEPTVVLRSLLEYP